MAVPFAEPDDLVFDRRTIAGPSALDLPGIHGRSMHIGPDDRVGGLGRARNAALDLRILDPRRQGREWLRRLIARLHFNTAPIDGAPIQPRWRTGLEPPEGQSDPL